jgi:hypothetical protein
MRTGRRRPLPATVLALAKAVGIAPDEALNLAGFVYAAPDDPEAPALEEGTT